MSGLPIKKCEAQNAKWWVELTAGQTERCFINYHVPFNLMIKKMAFFYLKYCSQFSNNSWACDWNVLLYLKTSIIWAAQILTVCTFANRTVPFSSFSSQMFCIIFAPQSFAFWKVNICLYKLIPSYFHCVRVSTSVITRFNILCKLHITMWQPKPQVQYH